MCGRISIDYGSRILKLARHVVSCAALGALLAGCSGSTTADEKTECPVPNHVGCAQPRGFYTTTYSERAGGTCGPMDPLSGEVSATRVTSFSGACSGDVNWSSDFCMASFVAKCPAEEYGPGFRNEQVSHTNYTMDALIRTGTFQLTVYDASGGVFCESMYDTLSENASCQQ